LLLNLYHIYLYRNSTVEPKVQAVTTNAQI
jgi:hypothetical protein